MWIAGTVTLVAALAPGHGSGLAERVGVGEWDSPVSLQQDGEPGIWLDRGVDPVLETGDRVRIYYRTPADAYVAILQIDTDGTTRMLYPRSPTENHYARANRDYRLLFPRSTYWNVDDRPGVGYFFIVTSPTPFDLSDFGYSPYDGGWDLSAVGSTVYEDPYVAMDDYVARLVPDWEEVSYGLDFISYNVGGPHEYPRFLCYQCHGFRPYSSWDPYRYSCLNFRVVVYDDPYFYPSRRYRADRVVLVGPGNPTRPRFEFKERVAGDPGTPVTVVRGGNTANPPRGPDRPRTDQRADGGRVAAPPVAPRPARLRAPNLSDRDDSAGSGSDRRRVITPPAVDEIPRRPTLERRPVSPTQAPREPSVGSPSAGPSRSPSTRRPAAPSGGSSSTQVAPRARSRTPAPSENTARPRASSGSTTRPGASSGSTTSPPAASRGTTRSSAGRPARSGAR